MVPGAWAAVPRFAEQTRPRPLSAASSNELTFDPGVSGRLARGSSRWRLPGGRHLPLLLGALCASPTLSPPTGFVRCPRRSRSFQRRLSVSLTLFAVRFKSHGSISLFSRPSALFFFCPGVCPGTGLLGPCRWISESVTLVPAGRAFT